jgi:hypothetical protein
MHQLASMQQTITFENPNAQREPQFAVRASGARERCSQQQCSQQQ